MTNEIRILREFIMEFAPFYNEPIAAQMNYDELIQAAKIVANSL